MKKFEICVIMFKYTKKNLRIHVNDFLLCAKIPSFDGIFQINNI